MSLTATIKGQTEATDANKIVIGLLDDVQKKCAMSKNLLNSKILDELAQALIELVKNPLKASVDAYNGILGTIKQLLDVIVVSYLSQNKDLVEKAYKNIIDENFLQYCVVLKSDTLENRSKFNRLLDVYEYSDFNGVVPIYIHFIPRELISNLINVQEVNIHNG